MHSKKRPNPLDFQRGKMASSVSALLPPHRRTSVNSDALAPLNEMVRFEGNFNGGIQQEGQEQHWRNNKDPRDMPSVARPHGTFNAMRLPPIISSNVPPQSSSSASIVPQYYANLKKSPYGEVLMDRKVSVKRMGMNSGREYVGMALSSEENGTDAPGRNLTSYEKRSSRLKNIALKSHSRIRTGEQHGGTNVSGEARNGTRSPGPTPRTGTPLNTTQPSSDDRIRSFSSLSARDHHFFSGAKRSLHGQSRLISTTISPLIAQRKGSLPSLPTPHRVHPSTLSQQSAKNTPSQHGSQISSIKHESLSARRASSTLSRPSRRDSFPNSLKPLTNQVFQASISRLFQLYKEVGIWDTEHASNFRRSHCQIPSKFAIEKITEEIDTVQKFQESYHHLNQLIHTRELQLDILQRLMDSYSANHHVGESFVDTIGQKTDKVITRLKLFRRRILSHLKSYNSQFSHIQIFLWFNSVDYKHKMKHDLEFFKESALNEMMKNREARSVMTPASPRHESRSLSSKSESWAARASISPRNQSPIQTKTSPQSKRNFKYQHRTELEHMQSQNDLINGNRDVATKKLLALIEGITNEASDDVESSPPSPKLSSGIGTWNRVSSRGNDVDTVHSDFSPDAGRHSLESQLSRVTTLPYENIRKSPLSSPSNEHNLNKQTTSPQNHNGSPMRQSRIHSIQNEYPSPTNERVLAKIQRQLELERKEETRQENLRIRMEHYRERKEEEYHDLIQMIQTRYDADFMRRHRDQISPPRVKRLLVDAKTGIALSYFGHSRNSDPEKSHHYFGERLTAPKLSSYELMDWWDKHQNQLGVLLLALWRGHKARQQLSLENDCSRKIQNVWFAFRERLRVHHVYLQPYTPEGRILLRVRQNLEHLAKECEVRRQRQVTLQQLNVLALERRKTNPPMDPLCEQSSGEHRAAMRIQRCWRGIIARKMVQKLRLLVEQEAAQDMLKQGAGQKQTHNSSSRTRVQAF